MHHSVKRRLALALTGLAAMMLPVANAALVPYNTDLAGPVLGSSIATLNDDFTGSIGNLDSEVFLNTDGIYTYVFTMSANIEGISEINTGFEVFGLIADGTEVGFSFSEAAAAGGTGTAADVSVFNDPDGTLDYEINGSWFGSSDTLTFHFRSTLGPEEGEYNAINGRVGSAKGFATVVPLPGAVWLMLSAFVGLGAMRRRQH